jgi:hypothetical protein
MPTRHRVKPGEGTTSISELYGFSDQTIWSHPDNADLRARRSDMNALMPGDELVIPDKVAKEVDRPAGASHTFKRKGIPAKYRVQLVSRGKPLANRPYELLIDDVPILTSAVLGTEHDFGKLARGRTLIGGLGFGGTLRGALETDATEIVVVEQLKTIVKLMKGELKHLAKGMDDPRVKVVRGDVREEIERARELDAILLDVDNGPEWAAFTENARLYDDEGLAAAKRALRKGGIYAVWSGYPVDAFQEQLHANGFTPSVVEYREQGRVQARAYVGTT